MSIAVAESPVQSVVATLESESAFAPAAQRPLKCLGFFARPLFAPEPAGPSCRRTPSRKALWLQVPEEGIAFLTFDPGQGPRLSAGPPEVAADAVAIESVMLERMAFLAVRRSSRAVRINGAPAPRMAVLRPGDEMQAEDWVFTLSLFARGYLGPPLREHDPLTCPRCRTPIAPSRTVPDGPEHPIGLVYICPFCGAVHHCHGEEVPAESRLECAQMSGECARCFMPVVLDPEGEYSHAPRD